MGGNVQPEFPGGLSCGDEVAEQLDLLCAVAVSVVRWGEFESLAVEPDVYSLSMVHPTAQLGSGAMA